MGGGCRESGQGARVSINFAYDFDVTETGPPSQGLQADAHGYDSGGPPSRFALTFACIRERRLVRKGGFEPPRSCERQPLKLVRLPVPPLPLRRVDGVVSRYLTSATCQHRTVVVQNQSSIWQKRSELGFQPTH